MNDSDEPGDIGLNIGFILDISNKLSDQHASIIVLILIVNTVHIIVIRLKPILNLFHPSAHEFHFSCSFSILSFRV